MKKDRVEAGAQVSLSLSLARSLSLPEPPCSPRHSPTLGSLGASVSYERGTPVGVQLHVQVSTRDPTPQSQPTNYTGVLGGWGFLMSEVPLCDPKPQPPDQVISNLWLWPTPI